MSSTQVSQTLFRFVSVRNPQLSNEVDKGKRFVYRPNEVKNQPAAVNVFDAAIANGDGSGKLALLAAAATPFKNSTAYLANEKAVETLCGSSLYEFANWLARNRDSFTNTELLAKAGAAGSPLSTANATTLWNNLFYQVITQEAFYTKEAIMHLLVANHVLVNVDSNEDETIGFANNQLIAKATVVLPKELFLEENSNSDDTQPGVQTSVTTNPQQQAASPSMRQAQAVLAAKRFNKKYDALKKEIEDLEKRYRNEYHAAYETAYEAYREGIKPIIDEYNNNSAAAKAAWCATRQNGTISLNPDDPCNQPPVLNEPNIPKFVFTFQSEVAYLQERLAAEDIELLNSLSSPKKKQPDTNTDIPVASIVPNVTGIVADGFSSIYNDIARCITQNNEIIISNSTNQADSVVVIGGIPINTAANETPNYFTYQICPRVQIDRVFFDMEFSVPDSSWVFSDIEYTNLNVNNFPGYSHYVIPGRNGNTLFLADLFGDDDYPFYLLSSYQEINGTIYFTNGKRRTFKINLEGYNYALCKLGKLSDPGNTGVGTGNGGDTGNEAEVFKPTGFGVKQLGIADYKKVEQTVHCYVEGEVAHIENIMAREYKEKSTRRLRKSENTTTVSTESESEQLNDTTTTDRFEMQSEVAKVMQQSRDFSANTSLSGTKFGVTVSAGANFASHNSKEQSTRAAITQAKDITERAMDRIVSRVKEERIEKIIEEFEENNKHGFDNTKGDKHVVGVYRWVDKIYKNQIFNYGKRLMFEFMIPEPARLHYLGMKDSKNNTTGKVLVKPIDPRTASQMAIPTAAVIDEVYAKYWAGFYNTEIEAKPMDSITVGKAFDYNTQNVNQVMSKSGAIEIPDGYESTKAHIYFTGMHAGGDTGWDKKIIATVGNQAQMEFPNRLKDLGQHFFDVKPFKHEIPVAVTFCNFHVAAINFTVQCSLTQEAYAAWQLQTFNAIVKSYEKAQALYEDELAQQQAVAENIKGTNPGFYRDIENVVLRKNCISYLINQSQTARLTYGKPMYKAEGQHSFTSYEVNVTKALDDYTAFAKFLEQAFEWNIMSYHFYPYYWGNRSNWPALYQYDNNDPLFRSFIQSGLARVVVTVRPGFEDAVRFYMQTGLVWNGGEVPVIDDPLHLSIIDELKEPQGKPEGKAWATRIPTSLTILQADSIGLKVEKALPCNCDDVSVDTWENPDAVPCGDNFVVTKDILNNGAGSGSQVTFSFTEMDKNMFTTIQAFDSFALFPRVFQCMGQQITINRDANWQASDNTQVVFEKLAEQLSLIPGIKAVQKTATNGNPAGITFTVDGSKVALFTFKKPGASEELDMLKVSITNDSVAILIGTQYCERILDAANNELLDTEVNKLLPISKFKA